MRHLVLAVILLFAASATASAEEDPGTVLFPPLGCSDDVPYISWNGVLGEQVRCRNGQHVLLNALPHCKDGDKVVYREMRTTPSGPIVAKFVCARNGNFHGARIMLGSPSPIPSGTPGSDPNRYSYYVKFDDVNYDTDHLFTAPGTFTIPEGVKKVRATANVGYDIPLKANTDAFIVCGQYRARAAGVQKYEDGENGFIYNLSTGVIPVSPGETCRVHYFQNSGRTIIISNNNAEGRSDADPTCPCYLDNWFAIEIVEEEISDEDFSRIPVSQ